MFDFILHFVVKKIVPPLRKKNHAEIADFYIECHCEFKAFFSGHS